MRIKYLRLPAFGIFTEQAINFAPERGLHLIYGPNEAGKSTLLSAIGDALFGIPRVSSHAFLHKPAALRIVLGLELADGRELGFIRRRGTKNTILDLHENALPEDVLAPYLAGLTREEFEEMFGLDHLRLREGGQRLLAAGGEFSQSLFEAASGLRHLREIFQDLEDRARALYLPQGQKPPVNRLVKEYGEQRQKAANAGLSPQAFQELEARYQREREELQELARRIKELRSRQSRLQRIQRTKPLLTQRDALERRREELGTLPLLPPGSLQIYQDVTAQLQSAAQQGETLRRQIKELQAQLEGLEVSAELLAHAETVSELFSGLGKYQEWVENLPQVELEIAAAAQRALSRLKDLQPSAESLEEAEQYRRPLTAVALVEDLAAEYAAIQTELTKAREAVALRSAELERTRQKLAALGPLQDTTALQGLARRIQAKGDLEQHYQNQLLALKQQEELLQGQLSRLALWSGSVAELAQAKLPAASTVESFRQEQEGLKAERSTLGREIKELQGKLASLELEIKLQGVGGAVPAEGDLLAARKRRDWGWQLVRRAWLEGELDQEQEKQFSAGKPLAEAYEESVREADQVADRLRREADRVAQLQNLELELARTRETLEGKKRAEEELSAREEDFERRWLALWAGLPLEPLDPAAMKDWLQEVGKLVEGFTQLQQARLAAQQLKEDVESLRAQLGAALQKVGAAAEGSLAELLERAGVLHDQATKRLGEQASLQQALSDQQAALSRDQGNLKAALEKEQAWSSRWAEALGQLGLPASTTVHVAQRYAAALQQLFALLDQLRKDEQLRDQQRQFKAAYEGQVAQVVEECALDLTLENTVLTVRELMGRVQAAQQNQSAREEILKQLERAEKSLKELAAQAALSREKLGELMDLAHCSSQGELEQLLKRHAAAEELREKIKGLEEQLLSTGDGLSLQDLQAEGEGVDVDSLPGELAQLAKELEELEAQQGALNRAFGVTEKEYKEQVQGTSLAALEAAEQAQATLARLAGEVEQYVQYKLAAAILHRAVDRYAQEHQNPVLKRAGEIFRELTAGSFTSLVADYDERDNLVIKGERAGELVGVQGMSDGTQDQLYLALRLASIERYLEAREPLPVILDDVLINFDDRRAAAALRTLADLGRRTQVIMFTHHLSMVELAQKELAAEDFALYFLDRAGKLEPGGRGVEAAAYR
ncbi:MAG TPA: AAA family ATPase [Limnochordia bacterium]|nr:AAA family ATPase [Limnochordia bacterium]